MKQFCHFCHKPILELYHDDTVLVCRKHILPVYHSDYSILMQYIINNIKYSIFIIKNNWTIELGVDSSYIYKKLYSGKIPNNFNPDTALIFIKKILSMKSLL